MKYILIAIFIAQGNSAPVYETRQFPDKASCQSLAKRYVERPTRGQKRAFCMPLQGI